jgi:hypothetical protein
LCLRDILLAEYDGYVYGSAGMILNDGQGCIQ